MASSAERAQHFLRLQRAALFGAAAAAFASMAVSFELPPWAEALFGAAWILGLAVRERSWPRLQRAATLATAAGILWTLLPALRDRDQLSLAASEAALILCANRLLIRRSAGDDAMLHLSCWMMLAGGAALSGDLLYGASLLGYAILSSVSMTLSELRRGIEEEAPEQAQALLSAPELTSRSLWGFSATLGLFAALFGVCLFPLFPRAQAGLLHGLGGGGRRATGIGDRVDLRAKGELSGSSRLVLRARLTGDLERARYWRVATFESFTGRGWSAGQGPGHAIAGVEAHGSEALVSGSFTLFAASDGRVPAPPGLLELWPEGLEEEDGSAGRRAEAAGPEHFSVRLRQSPAGDLRVFPPVPPELAFRFAAGAPEAEEDGSAGRRATAEGPERSIERPDPVELARDLQLPELDPEIQRLARRLIPDGASPRDAARSVKRHLGSFRYTRELFGGDQPLGDFLRRKSGHCELFATAAVVLLRARGLPARYVAGYYGGAVRGERLTLREWDAHAWAELYVPGEGFVPLDATPPDLRGGSEERGSLWSGLLDRWDDAQLAWLRHVVDFDARSQAHATSWVASRIARLAAPSPGHPFWRTFWALVASLALLVLLRRLRQREPVALRLERALFRALEALGLVRRPTESCEEALTRLAALAPAAATKAAPIFSRLGAARFGRRPLRPGEATALRARIARLSE